MAKKKNREMQLPQQIDEFKKQNPKIAEAMELFGITMTKYQETLHALYAPNVYPSNSTVRLDKPDK